MGTLNNLKPQIMKKLLIFLFYRSLTQREYHFEDSMEAEAFAVYFGGFADLDANGNYTVTI